MNQHNKKQKLLQYLLVPLIIVTGIICFICYLNVPRKLNVLLITIDALRYDHLSCYGYKRNTAPNIDKFSREGVLFTQAIAQSSRTPTSIPTIATSTYPNQHLFLEWGNHIKSNLATIANILKSRGYRTIFVGGAENFFTGLHGLDKGFDIFYAKDNDANTVTNKALEFILKDINRPFFLRIHYMDVHAPYNPGRFDKLYIDDELYDRQKKLPIVKDTFYGYGYKGIPEGLAQKNGEIDNPDYYIAHYDGAIRSVDEQIGVLLARLRALNLDKNTIIIITSDHGEMLGEHGYYFHHGYFIYEPLIRIPLIMKCRGVIPQHKAIDGQVSAHIDIGPTILDILRIHKIKTMEGRSLLPIILGKKKTPLYIFSDEGYTSKCIRTEEWSLIHNNANKEYELYNLKTDPGELNNVVETEKEKFNFLRLKLDRYKQADRQTNRATPILDDNTRTRLKSLGYVQ